MPPPDATPAPTPPAAPAAAQPGSSSSSSSASSPPANSPPPALLENPYEKHIVNYWLQGSVARTGPWKNALDAVTQVEAILLEMVEAGRLPATLSTESIRLATTLAFEEKPQLAGDAIARRAAEALRSGAPISNPYHRSLDTPLAEPAPTTPVRIPIPEGLEVFETPSPDASSGPRTALRGDGSAPRSPLRWVARQCLSLGVRVSPKVERSPPTFLTLLCGALGLGRGGNAAKRAAPDSSAGDDESTPGQQKRRRTTGQPTPWGVDETPVGEGGGGGGGGAVSLPEVSVEASGTLLDYLVDAAGQSSVHRLAYLRVPRGRGVAPGGGCGVIQEYAAVGPASRTFEGNAARCFVKVRLSGGGSSGSSSTRFFNAPPAALALGRPGGAGGVVPLSRTSCITLKRGESAVIAREAAALALSKIRIATVTLPGTPPAALDAFGMAVHRLFPDSLLFFIPATSSGAWDYHVCICGLACDVALGWLRDTSAPIAVELAADPPQEWAAIASSLKRAHGGSIWCAAAAGQLGCGPRTPLWCLTEGGLLTPAMSVALERAVRSDSRVLLPVRSGVLLGCGGPAEPWRDAGLFKLASVSQGEVAGGPHPRGTFGVFRAPGVLSHVHRVGDVVRVTRSDHLGHTVTVHNIEGTTMTVDADSYGALAFDVHVHDAVQVVRKGLIPIPVVQASFDAKVSLRIQGNGVFDFRLRAPPGGQQQQQQQQGDTPEGAEGGGDSAEGAQPPSPVLQARLPGGDRWATLTRLSLFSNGELLLVVADFVEEPTDGLRREIGFMHHIVPGAYVLGALTTLRSFCQAAQVSHNLFKIPAELSMPVEELMEFPDPTPPHETPGGGAWVAAAGPAPLRRHLLSETVALWGAPTAFLRTPPEATLCVMHHCQRIRDRAGVALLDCQPSGLLRAVGAPSAIAALRCAVAEVASAAAAAHQRRRARRLRDEVLEDMRNIRVSLPLPPHALQALRVEAEPGGPPPGFDPPAGSAGGTPFVESLNAAAASLVMLLATPKPPDPTPPTPPSPPPAPLGPLSRLPFGSLFAARGGGGGGGGGASEQTTSPEGAGGLLDGGGSGEAPAGGVACGSLWHSAIMGDLRVAAGDAVSGWVPEAGDEVLFTPPEAFRAMLRQQAADPPVPLRVSGRVVSVEATGGGGGGNPVCWVEGDPDARLHRFLPQELVLAGSGGEVGSSASRRRWRGVVSGVSLDGADPAAHRFALEWLRGVFYGPRVLLRPTLACVTVDLEGGAGAVQLRCPFADQMDVGRGGGSAGEGGGSSSSRSLVGSLMGELARFLQDFALCVTVEVALSKYPASLVIAGPAAASFCREIYDGACERADALAGAAHDSGTRELFLQCVVSLRRVVERVQAAADDPSELVRDDADPLSDSRFLPPEGVSERLSEILTRDICERYGVVGRVDLPEATLRLSGREDDLEAAISAIGRCFAQPRWSLPRSVDRTVPFAACRDDWAVLHLLKGALGLQDAHRTSEQAVALRGTQAQCEAAAAVLAGGEHHPPGPPPPPTTCSACLLGHDDHDGDDDPEPLHTLLCQHAVHPSCLRAFHAARLSTRQEEGAVGPVPVRCPALCSHILTVKEHTRILGAEGCLDHLEALVEQLMMERSDTRKCPGCGDWLACSPAFSETLRCHRCARRMCSNTAGGCGGRPHELSCDAFQEAEAAMLLRRGVAQGGEMAVQAAQGDAVPCRGCPALILRDTGGEETCTYMRCRQCNYEFCWLCLQPANDHRHIDPLQPFSTPACDPENRASRIVKHHTRPAFTLRISRRWLSCTVCGVSLASSEQQGSAAYECLQCLNMWLCSACEASGGCPEDTRHVVAELHTHEMLCGQGDPLEEATAKIGPVTPKFPAPIPLCKLCHRQAFGQVMQCTNHAYLVCRACAATLDTVSQRFGDDQACMVKGQWMYSTLLGVPVDGTVITGQTQYLKLPPGWELAEDTLEVRKVVQSHTWSTRKLVVASGRAFPTKGAPSGSALVVHRALAGSAAAGYRPHAVLPAPSQVLIRQPVSGPGALPSDLDIPWLQGSRPAPQAMSAADEYSLPVRLLFHMPLEPSDLTRR